MDSTGPSPAEKPPSARRLALRRAGLSICQKLLLLSLLLVSAVCAFLAINLPARQLEQLEDELRAKTVSFARFAAKQVESAIAFDDEATAREVFDSLMQDPDVASLTLFTAAGEVLQRHGTISSELESVRRGVEKPIVVPLKERFACVFPVRSLEGPRGTLVVELSKRRLSSTSAAVKRHAALAALGAMLAGAMGAFWVARSIARRLEAIAKVATAVAGGNLDVTPVIDTHGDEIGAMARAFSEMLRRLKALIAQTRDSAREAQQRLESLVAERTAELHSRNADMRLVLNSVGQGFVTLDREGRMSEERSRVLTRWLGPAPESELFADYLGAVAPETGESFAMAWGMLVAGDFPIELCLDQLPSTFQIGGRHIGINYRPILDDTKELERMVVVMSDMTSELERLRAEEDERELMHLVTCLLSDRVGLLAFLAETTALVDKIERDVDSLQLSRWIHTLKGNASIYGLGSIARLCHTLEDSLEANGSLSQAELLALRQRWSGIAKKLAPLEHRRESVELSREDYEEFARAVEHGADHDKLRHVVEGWLLEPVEKPLGRLAEHARALAVRLDKAPLRVVVEGAQVRLDPDGWQEFWSAAVHVVRNAVGHGLESPSERQALGKTAPACLILRARLNTDRLVLEFEDNGRGLNWLAIKERAASLGLPARTQAELLEALFAPGFSTLAEATEVAGRGVGLGAVREVCRNLGGRVEVDTRPGEGTTIRFVWPPLAARGRAEVSPEPSPSRPRRPLWHRSGSFHAVEERVEP